MQNVQAAISRSPSESTKRAYHIQVVHKLEAEDYASREAACHDLLEAVENNLIMEKSLVMRLHSTQVDMSRDNCRIWAEDQPNVMQVWEQDIPKVNVWLGLTRSIVYGPFIFAEETVTGNVYLDMVLEPQLISDGIIDTVFLQNGAPPYFAIKLFPVDGLAVQRQ